MASYARLTRHHVCTGQRIVGVEVPEKTVEHVLEGLKALQAGDLAPTAVPSSKGSKRSKGKKETRPTSEGGAPPGAVKTE